MSSLTFDIKKIITPNDPRIIDGDRPFYHVKTVIKGEDINFITHYPMEVVKFMCSFDPESERELFINEGYFTFIQYLNSMKPMEI